MLQVKWEGLLWCALFGNGRLGGPAELRVAQNMDEDAALWPDARGGDVYLKMNFVRHSTQPHPPADLQPRPPSYLDPHKAPGVERYLLPSISSISSHELTAKWCCHVFLEGLCLLPLILLACGCVLLPSALYFTPRDLFVNISSDFTTVMPLDTNFDTLEHSPENCSQGFLYTSHPTGNSCVPSCQDFRLDSSVASISVHRMVLMIAGALSCVSGLGFLLLAMTILRKSM